MTRNPPIETAEYTGYGLPAVVDTRLSWVMAKYNKSAISKLPFIKFGWVGGSVGRWVDGLREIGTQTGGGGAFFYTMP